METSFEDEITKPVKNVDYRSYYIDQAGYGIDPYVSYSRLPQRGRGFFGRIIKGSIMPILRSILPYLKEKTLDGVGGLVSDMKDGMSIKEAGKRQLKRTASQVMDDVVGKIGAQTGKGMRKRRKTNVKQGKRRARSSHKKKVNRRKGRRTRRTKKKKVVLFA